MKTIRDLSLSGKKVLLRTDFNVPLLPVDEEGICHVKDNTRIIASLKTIKYLIKNKAKVIIISHIGRPKDNKDPRFKLDGVALELQKILGQVVYKTANLFGPDVEETVNNLKPGEVVLLSNLRFDHREEKNDRVFAKQLADLAQIYINDAFSVSHRAHASVEAITNFLPSYSGFLLEEELNTLKKILKDVKKPFYLILGGAKPKEKIPVINNLINQIDGICLGGIICCAFFKAQDKDVGDYSFTKDDTFEVKRTIKNLMQNNIQMILPDEVITAQKNSLNKQMLKKIEDVSKKEIVGDISQESVSKMIQGLQSAKSIFFNGTLGIVEEEGLESGTKKLVEYLAKRGSDVIVCGGDTLSAIAKFGHSQSFPNRSLGGGATLEFLSGKKLPGIVALD